MTSEPNRKLEELASLRIDRDALEARPGRGRALRAIVWIALLAALGAGGWLAYGRWIEPLRIPEVEMGVASIQSPETASAILTAAGYVVAQRQASVTSKIPGRLAEFTVREGSRVKAGEVIGRLESRDITALLEQARRSLDAAKAASAEAVAVEFQARREFERQQRLLREGVASASDFDKAEAAYKVAQARVDSATAEVPVAQSAVTVAEVALDNTLIKSPFDGVVTTKNAEVGEIVAPLSVGGPARGNSVVLIADMRSLEAEVDVNESHIGRIREGQPAEIVLDAFPEKRYPGELRQIVPTANRQKATIQAKVAFKEKGDEVLPEMSARVTFLESAEKPSSGTARARVFVPKSAIVSVGGGPAVFVHREGRAEAVPVEPGPEVQGRIEILSGLRGGETILLDPPGGLASGARVRPRR